MTEQIERLVDWLASVLPYVLALLGIVLLLAFIDRVRSGPGQRDDEDRGTDA